VFTSGREVDTVGVCACVRESVLNESGSDGLWDGGSNCGAGGAARSPLRGSRVSKVAVTEKPAARNSAKWQKIVAMSWRPETKMAT